MSARAPLVVVLACFALRLVFALGTDTYPDEAYYWTWSLRPQLAYFDHPALISWSIALLGIRFGALLWGAITLVGVHRLTEALGGTREQAWWATALFASTPAAALLGALSTPDAPLLAFWVWTLVALLKDRAPLAGVLWGFAMLSKYNGILLGLPVLILFARKPLQLVITTLIALGVTSPTIIWNALNEWEGFRFQLWHGFDYAPGGLDTFLEFLGGQLLMGGPVLVLLMIWWLSREKAPAVLKATTLLPIVFFGYASWKTRGEANWTAAAWITACVGLAMTRFARWRIAAIALNVAVLAAGTALIVFPPEQLLTVPAIQKLHGWRWLERVGQEKVHVFTNRYQLSAMTSFYAKVSSSTVGGRRSQYDLWPKPQLASGSDALWVDEKEGPPGELMDQYEETVKLEWPLDERQRQLHPFMVFKLVRKK